MMSSTALLWFARWLPVFKRLSCHTVSDFPPPAAGRDTFDSSGTQNKVEQVPQGLPPSLGLEGFKVNFFSKHMFLMPHAGKYPQSPPI